MRKPQLEKELRDNAHLLRAWKRFHADQLAEVLAGPHGAAVARVIEFLERMEPQSAPALISLLHEHDWDQIDHNVRYVLLHEINQAITRLREKSGLPPIDDALPGERDTGFLVVRALLG
jgi:hypothetical protein